LEIGFSSNIICDTVSVWGPQQSMKMS